MSEYTVELRYICETYAGFKKSVGYNSIKAVIERSRSAIFDFDYPIFDYAYKSALETKILRHFYTREICCETVGNWKLWLENKMNEIMPYYNQLYKSQLLEFNPFYDVDLTREHTRKNDANNVRKNDGESVTEHNEDNTINNNGTTWSLYSDTPQSGVNGITGENMTNLNYLTNATKVTNSNQRNDDIKTDTKVTTDDTTTDTIDSLEKYTEHVKGKSVGGVTYSELLMKFRETFLNIDMMIIDELDELFFRLW